MMTRPGERVLYDADKTSLDEKIVEFNRLRMPHIRAMEARRRKNAQKRAKLRKSGA